MATTKTLLVEGWRGINHSFALVNQHQLLHLRGRPGLTVYHRDVAYKRSEWRETGSGFDDHDAEIIAAYGPPPANQEIDVLYRITYPFQFSGGAAKRVFVFCTSEFGKIPHDAISSELPALDCGAHRRDFEIITPSKWSQDGILRYGYADKVHLVPLGIDPDLFWFAQKSEKQRIRKQFELPANAFIFLNVGAMTWNKGITPLLVAFAIHKKSYPESVLVLKGANFLYGDMFTRALQEARKADPQAVDSASQSIIYNGGNLSHDALAALYRASDAYVSPYLAEAFNLPVLEAIACGLPVIVTDGGPTDDFCRPEFTLKIASDFVNSDKGRYLKPDTDDLVRQMAIAVENDNLRVTASKAGPAWASSHYSWQSVAQKLIDVLMA